MKKTIKVVTVFTLLITSLMFCRKNDKLSVDDSFEGFVKKMKSPVDLATVNGATGGVVTLSGGAKITFPPNAFTNSSGAIIAADVTIEGKESRKKSQWLFDNLSTLTDAGLPLQSGGMLHIAARLKQTGEELKLAPAMQVPNGPTGNLNNVVKVEMLIDPKGPIDLNLWIPKDTPVVNQPQTPTVIIPAAPVSSWSNASYFPFSKGPNTYLFQLPKFKWVNCDGLVGIPGTKTTVKVTPSGSGMTGATNIQAMIIYRNVNTVLTLVPKVGYLESYTNSIPVGSTADVIVIGKTANGKILFQAIKNTVITANMNISMTPLEETAVNVEAYMMGLN